MSWVACPRCGSSRDQYEEPCGCIITACDACLFIEINSECCNIRSSAELFVKLWIEEVDSKDNTMVH